MRYELYYWPSIQGRGEFIRLALEEAGADYIDVARRAGKSGGIPALLKVLNDPKTKTPAFAPPILKAGKVTLAQTANILQFLGPRLGLAPASEAGRLFVHQLQLTVSDFVDEIHDSHHPIASSLYYEDQKKESIRRAPHLTRERLPKFFGYFERALKANGRYLAGSKLTYADLSVFQVIEGLRYAFPNAMKKLEPTYPLIVSLHDRVAARPNIAAYLASKRRIPFNQMGVFRRYPELDKG